jgi:multiple sugar transport system substrate-binding protein
VAQPACGQPAEVTRAEPDQRTRGGERLKAHQAGQKGTAMNGNRISLTRRRFTALAAVAGAGVAQPACGGGAGPGQSGGGQATLPPANLRFGHQSGAVDEPAFAEVSAAFNTRMEARKITVQPEVLGPLADLNQKLTTLVSAGTPPDIVYHSVRYVLSLFISKAIVELTPRMTRDSNTRPGQIAKVALDDQSWNGGQVGLPIDYASSHLQYNRTAVATAGATDPVEAWRQNRWSWDTFLDTSRRVAKPPELWGTIVSTWDGAWPQPIWANGGEILSDDRRTCLLDRPEAHEAVQFMADWALRHRVAAAPGEQPAGQSFEAGHIAIAAANVTSVQAVRQRTQAANFEFDYVPFPVRKKAITTTFGAGVSLMANSKAQDQAWQFISYLATEEAQLTRARITGRYPARLGLGEKYFQEMSFSSTSPPRNGVSVLEEINRQARPLPYTPDWIRWRQIITDEIFTPVFAGQLNARDATARAVPLINAVLAAEQR